LRHGFFREDSPHGCLGPPSFSQEWIRTIPQTGAVICRCDRIHAVRKGNFEVLDGVGFRHQLSLPVLMGLPTLWGALRNLTPSPLGFLKLKLQSEEKFPEWQPGLLTPISSLCTELPFFPLFLGLFTYLVFSLHPIAFLFSNCDYVVILAT